MFAPSPASVEAMALMWAAPRLGAMAVITQRCEPLTLAAAVAEALAPPV